MTEIPQRKSDVIFPGQKLIWQGRQFILSKNAHGMPCLKQLPSELPDATLQMLKNLTLIGREIDNDGQLQNLENSRYHAAVMEFKDGDLFIMDAGSFNGTYFDKGAGWEKLPTSHWVRLKEGRRIAFDSKTVYTVRRNSEGKLELSEHNNPYKYLWTESK
jgi:hypothetical protein